MSGGRSPFSTCLHDTREHSSLTPTRRYVQPKWYPVQSIVYWGRFQGLQSCTKLKHVLMHLIINPAPQTIAPLASFTVNWKIFVLKIFRKQNFRVKKFRSYGWAKLLTRWPKGDVISRAQEFDCVWRDLAWRSSEEIVAFSANMYIKRCERQLLEKC